MAAKRVRYVDVTGPDGEQFCFGPDDDLPEWADDVIDNPSVYGEAVDASTGPERPPEAGKGSGRDAWAEYAQAVGVGVDDEMSRDDIIEAVDASTSDS